MNRKYYLKKHAKNEFTALTGIEAFTLAGGDACLITRDLSKDRQPIQKYAYYKYNSLEYKYNPDIKISCTCGFLNCVKREHIKAIYKPKRASLDYLKNYLKVDGLEYAAHTLEVPPELLTSYLNSVIEK